MRRATSSARRLGRAAVATRRRTPPRSRRGARAQSASGFGLVHVLVPVGAAVPHRGAQSRHRSPQPASTPREGMRAMPRHAVAVAVRRLARRLALGVRASQHAARRRVCSRVVGRHDTTFCVRSWLRRAKRNGVHILTRMQFALFPKRRRHFIRKVGPRVRAQPQRAFASHAPTSFPRRSGTKTMSAASLPRARAALAGAPRAPGKKGLGGRIHAAAVNRRGGRVGFPRRAPPSPSRPAATRRRPARRARRSARRCPW